VEFAHSGGLVIGIDLLPRYSSDGNDEFVSGMIKDLFEPHIDKKSNYTEKKFTGGGASYYLSETKHVTRFLGDADLKLTKADPRILYTHRRSEETDIYFITNISFMPTENNFRFSATGKPEIWDPRTGKIKESVFSIVGDKTSLDLKLRKYEGIFVAFKH